MFDDVYKTTLRRSYRIEDIKTAIKKSMIVGDNPFRYTAYGLGKTVIALTGPDEHIPPFAHPLYLSGREYGLYADTVVFDARGLVRVQRDGTVTINNPDEFNFQARRASLTQYAISNHLQDLKNISTFPLMVFTQWLSETITRRMDLDPVAQQRTQVITAIYYLSLFRDLHESEWTETDIVKTARTLSTTMRLDAELVVSLMRVLPVMHDVNEYITALKDFGGSIRFENINLGMLVTIIGSSWFCANHAEVIASALEHVPTWLSIIASTSASKNYKQTSIGKIVDRLDRGDAAVDFRRALQKLPNLHYTPV